MTYLELIKILQTQYTEFALLIAFFGHLVKGSKTIQSIFVKLNIVNEIYNTFSIETNDNDEIDSKIYFFSVFDNGEIYEQNPQLSIKFEKIFRETTLFYSSNDLFDTNLSTINNCLWGISNVSICSDQEFLHQLFSHSIIEYFLDLKIQREQFVLPTIILIGNLLGTSDLNVIKKMIELGCVEYITQTILLNKHRNIEEALWALSNIIVDKNLIDYIFEKQLDVFLLDLLENGNLNNGSIKEIFISFGGLIANMDSSQYYKMNNIRIRICKVLVHTLQYCKNEEIVYLIVHFNKLLFQKDKEKIFIAPFVIYGGGDLIERISSLFINEQFQIICNQIQSLLN